MDPLDDFRSVSFRQDNTSKLVYWLGQGPAVLVLSEMPGITPRVADFARRIVAAGYTAVMPSLFGVDGKPPSNGYLAASGSKGCVSREFVAFATGKSSPITTWLRALAAHAHHECGGPGVGVVGMCFSGGFALAMMVDERVLVPVLSQPAMPLPVGAARKRDLSVSADELRIVKERTAAGACVIGLRFTHDPLVPVERFDRLRAELGDGFIGIEIDSAPGNEHGFAKDAHSVLTEEFSDEPGHPTHDAFELVLEHLRRKLQVAERPT